jgi:hypothetical protein
LRSVRRRRSAHGRIDEVCELKACLVECVDTLAEDTESLLAICPSSVALLGKLKNCDVDESLRITGFLLPLRLGDAELGKYSLDLVIDVDEFSAPGPRTPAPGETSFDQRS